MSEEMIRAGLVILADLIVKITSLFLQYYRRRKSDRNAPTPSSEDEPDDEMIDSTCLLDEPQRTSTSLSPGSAESATKSRG